MSAEEQPEEFYLELGDIIKINAPDNSDIDGKTFYIDYLDENRATIVDPETLAELVLDILDGQFTDESIVGINIYNPKTGLRSKLRNPTYEHVRRLKGNSPKIQFQYYSLRQVGKVGEFLKYYNEFRPKFTELRKDLHQWTDQLWKNYVRCYVQKEKPLLEFPKKFRVHMFNLHQIYLNDLQELGHYISRQIVIKYVNSLEPAKLMYSINYDFRCCKTDEKKVTMKIEN